MFGYPCIRSHQINQSHFLAAKNYWHNFLIIIICYIWQYYYHSCIWCHLPSSLLFVVLSSLVPMTTGTILVGTSHPGGAGALTTFLRLKKIRLIRMVAHISSGWLLTCQTQGSLTVQSGSTHPHVLPTMAQSGGLSGLQPPKTSHLENLTLTNASVQTFFWLHL